MLEDRILDGKLDRLRRSLVDMGRMVLGFSGGVDSSFLLRVAHDSVGRGVVALTTVSPTNPEEDTEDATTLARELGAEHVVVEANELEIPGYGANPVNRCYLCKTNLYEIAAAEAERRSIRWIVDGVNVDDLGDHRPGLDAARERGVRHPLVEAELTKADIRELSRRLGLKTWDRPASPCLSSRFPYGTEITAEALTRVAAGERLLRELGFRECRVRAHGPVARLEVRVEDIPRLVTSEIRQRVAATLREAGFDYVTIDLEGFRSGSLNREIGHGDRGSPRRDEDRRLS